MKFFLVYAGVLIVNCSAGYQDLKNERKKRQPKMNKKGNTLTELFSKVADMEIQRCPPSLPIKLLKGYNQG